MKLLLIDAHSLGYFTQQGTSLSVAGRQVQSIYGTIKNIRKYVQTLKATPIMLWDGKPTKRSELYAGYKGKRSTNPQLQEMRQEFRQQKDDIKLMLSQLGVRQLIAEDGEADDLAGMLVDKYKAKAEHIYLYTGDGDWLQLLDDNVTMIPIRDPKLLGIDMLGEKTGYSNVKQFLEAKALTGDKSDEIDGVGGIGEKGAMELLTEFGSVIEFVKKVRSGEVTVDDLTSRSRKKFIALANNDYNEKCGMGMLEVFKRNLQLMDLNNKTMMPDTITAIPNTKDHDAFLSKCRELAFKSFLEDDEVFLIPFNRYCK